MGVPHKVVIARGKLVKQHIHRKYTMYTVIIHKRKGIPSDLESFVGKEVTVILADDGQNQGGGE